MKFLLLPVFFLMCSPAFSITLEECQSYTNDFLKKNVTESETDEVYPYRLKTIDVLAGFDTNKLGLELNHSILEKWRASCVNKPDMSVPVCDNVFPVQCERKPEHAERTGCFERNGNARLHGILNPDKKKLDKMRKEGEDYARKMSAEIKGKVPDCKEGERLYLSERKVATKIRGEFSQLLKKTL